MVETKCIHVDRAGAHVATADVFSQGDVRPTNILMSSSLIDGTPSVLTGAMRGSIPTYEIPSVLTGTTGPLQVSALGDTCAMFNFMSPVCAASLGLKVDTTASKVVTVGSGARLQTAGVVETQYHFQGEPESTYSLMFHILPNAVQHLILGRTFLKLTRTYTTRANFLTRVKKTVMNTLRQHRLLYLGDNAPKFLGRLNGTFVDALADTGSNVLIMDEAYAHEHGLLIKRGRQYRTRLLFADGTTKMTSGVTSKVR